MLPYRFTAPASARVRVSPQAPTTWTVIFAWMSLVYGITYTLTRADLTKGVRSWVYCRSVFFGTLLACPICSSFWIGLLTHLFFPIPIWPERWPVIVKAAASGFSALTFTWTLRAPVEARR